MVHSRLGSWQIHSWPGLWVPAYDLVAMHTNAIMNIWHYYKCAFGYWKNYEELQNSKHDLEGRKGVADSHLLLYISRNAIF